MKPIRSIIIVGGGTAGWLAACYLQRILCADPASAVEITLIESPEIGVIGVGEATVPTLRSTLQAIGLPESDLFADADASLKNGIRFVGWREGGAAETDRYDHPFEAPGIYGGHSTALHWMNLKQRGAMQASMADVCVVQTALMDAGMSPKLMQSADYQGPVSYAYHFDAVKFGALLRRTALSRGVRHLTGEVVAADTEGDERIVAVELADGSHHAADFFVDCSGFRSLLLGQALEVPWVSYAQWLPCDRALAMPLAWEQEHAPMRSYTTATAQPAGWTWEIDLPSRTGLGYVYSSAHCSDDEARATLHKMAGTRVPLADPRALRMRVGHHARLWHGNCLALGLAGGFIEPLESTAIYLIEYGLQMFVDHLPGAGDTHLQRERFNALMADVYAELRDFVVLHYAISMRRDTPFWRDVTDPSAIPPSLSEALRLWQEKVPSPTDMHRRLSLFGAHNWFYILAGLRWLPLQGSALARHLPAATSAAALDGVRRVREQACDASPPMRDYIRKMQAALAGRPTDA